jgi:WD40 repeat protein
MKQTNAKLVWAPDHNTQHNDVNRQLYHAVSAVATAPVHLGDSPVKEGAVNALVAMPDNQHALSASDDMTVKLFTFKYQVAANIGTVVRTFTHHTGPVRCLALMPDGRRFVSGSDDMTARIVEHGL